MKRNNEVPLEGWCVLALGCMESWGGLVNWLLFWGGLVNWLLFFII
ncbi:hypothetical protein PVAP13_8KG106401 [Panicum virgatum]|uniref:Uncharacterized protein n=1 Tax=Panicum virgatum TaxID=38727 RepID=A0A8T0PJR3_PANVG|nr:hypothetical protein PVAP13_8KG106401 [Panicum virgatum]